MPCAPRKVSFPSSALVDKGKENPESQSLQQRECSWKEGAAQRQPAFVSGVTLPENPEHLGMLVCSPGVSVAATLQPPTMWLPTHDDGCASPSLMWLQQSAFAGPQGLDLSRPASEAYKCTGWNEYGVCLASGPRAGWHWELLLPILVPRDRQAAWARRTRRTQSSVQQLGVWLCWRRCDTAALGSSCRQQLRGGRWTAWARVMWCARP